jgi:type VI secretion system protein ImpF
MASDANPRLRLSVVDRLLLEDDSEDLSPIRMQGRLRDSVRRDLEMLLNSRRYCKSWPRAANELDKSVLSFGLADLYALPLTTDSQRESFRASVEEIVRRFEPRFRSVSVTLLKNSEEFDRTLRFRIQAVLIADVEGDPVVYDSLLDPALRSFTVTDAKNE